MSTALPTIQQVNAS